MMFRTWQPFSRRLPEHALERRLHRRAVLYWERIRRGEQVPTLQDFDPLAIEDDFNHGFLLVLGEPGQPMFASVGPVLEQEAGIEGMPIGYDRVPNGSLLKRFACHYPRVLRSGAPEMAEYDFVTAAGYHVLCRGALLPLSSDGRTIDHVYGVVSWKSQKVETPDS